EVPNILPQGTAYKYDQLNRILEEQAYTNLSIFSNSWDAGSTYANRYHNVFSYDANGNILTQERADASGLSFDQLTYNYRTDGLGNKYQNRLYQVQDAASNSDATDDIDDQDQSTPIGVGHAYDNANANTANNYQYDEIGNLVKDQQEEIDNITWTVYGKIKSITRASGSTKSDLEFNYDANGNRISKIEKPRPGGTPSSSSDWITTYYARDAQGNIMTTYKLAPVSLATSFKVTERNIFGSARLGIEKTEIELTPPIPATPSPFVRTLGNKQYEASNHLGNVLVVFTDKKYPRDDDADGIIDYFQPEVIASNDYYAFGSPMDGRTFSSNKYRYGFNGKEKDDEVKGGGASYDYGFRIYDVRLGKFLSVDPLFQSYPWFTPYQFAANMPIWAVDLDGLEQKKATVKTFVEKYMNGKVFERTVEITPGNADLNTQIMLRTEDYSTDKVFKSGRTQQLGSEAPLGEPLVPLTPSPLVSNLVQTNLPDQLKPATIPDDIVKIKKPSSNTAARINKISMPAGDESVYMSAADQSWIPGETHNGKPANQGDIGSDLEQRLGKMVKEIQTSTNPPKQIDISVIIINDTGGPALGYRMAAENLGYNIKKYLKTNLPNIQINETHGVVRPEEIKADTPTGVSVTPKS
ncbi:MAG: hypothetical protein JWP12_1299, partial [Bacteroidetes bacterium]|nr:hypothetical protein [Bacteroidota bacterium]